MRVLIGSVVIAAVCVFVTRLLKLEPPYLYGLIAVYVFETELVGRVAGRLTAAAPDLCSVSALLLGRSTRRYTRLSPAKSRRQASPPSRRRRLARGLRDRSRIPRFRPPSAPIPTREGPLRLEPRRLAALVRMRGVLLCRGASRPQ